MADPQAGETTGQTDITTCLNKCINEPENNEGFIFDFQNPEVGGGVVFQTKMMEWISLG